MAFLVFYIAGILLIGLPTGVRAGRDILQYKLRLDFGDYWAAGFFAVLTAFGWPLLIFPAIGWLISRSVT